MQKKEISSSIKVPLELREEIRADIILSEPIEQKNSYYIQLLETLSTVIWVIDIKTFKVLYISPLINRFGLITATDAFNSTLDEFLTPESYSSIDQVVKEELEFYSKTEESRTRIVEYELSKNKNSRISIKTQIFLLFNENGKPFAVAGISHNITEQKQFEEALYESNEHYQTLVNNIPIGVFRITSDPEGKILMTNPAFLEIFGFKSEKQAKQTSIYDLFINPSEGMIFFDQVFTQGSVNEFKLHMKDKKGSLIWGSVTAQIVYKKKKEKYFHCSVEDMTDYKIAELTLQENGLLFRTIFEKSPVGIAIYTPNGSLIDVNKKMLSIFGLPDIKSFNEYNLLLKLISLQEVRLQLNKKRTVKIETTVDFSNARSEGLAKTVKSGIYYHEVYLAEVQKDDIEAFHGYLILIQDITEKKNAEILQHDLEEKRSVFISMTSHELRKPLTVINYYIELLEMHLNKFPPEIHSSFRAIKKSIYRLDKLIDNVKLHPKMGINDFKLDLTIFDFHELMIEINQIYSDLLGDQIIFHHNGSQSPSFIKGDPDYLHQAIDNIIDNAIKHTSDKNREIIIDTKVQHNTVQLEISDNGAGIPLEYQESIFEEFISIPSEYCAKSTGLGLSIAQKIIKSHNGVITVQSKGKGHGTKFFIEIPLYIPIMKSKRE